jgi:hypothetical protein
MASPVSSPVLGLLHLKCNMPRRIVKQPNGLFAEFSTIVDDFTILNMTEAEAYDHCRSEMGIDDAHKKIERARTDEKYIHVFPALRGDGLWRWRHELETIRDIHGVNIARNRVAFVMGFTEKWLEYSEGDNYKRDWRE